MILSPEEVKELERLKTEAARKNCPIIHKGDEFKVFRKQGQSLIFVGKRDNLKSLEKFIKKL